MPIAFPEHLSLHKERYRDEAVRALVREDAEKASAVKGEELHVSRETSIALKQ